MKKKEFFEKIKNKLFIDDLDKITKYVKINFEKDVKNIIHAADKVVNKEFLFDCRWDMERTYEPVIFYKNINWLYVPSDDKEWIYQFNRHQYFITLGQAYSLTHDEKYAEAFVFMITDWINKVKLSDEKNKEAWRTIEAGIRLENWIKAICYFEDSNFVNDEVCTLFVNSIIEHSEYLMEIYDSFRLVSNWGVLQNHGLFIAGVLLNCLDINEGKKYLKESIKRLEDEIEIQVYDDGVHWEQSPMYHNEVEQDFLDVKILANKNNIALSDNFNKKLKKMCYASLYHKKPNDCELCMGDSDEIDIRDILTKGASIFNDPVLKSGGYEKFDFDSIWDLGYYPSQKYLDIKADVPSVNAIELRDSGNYYIHSNWSNNENFFHFYCGTLGAGHGHSDKLHIDLFTNGEDILLDGGRYTYVNKKERYEFKDPEEHNTITVDDKKFTICKDSWECSKLSRGIKQSLKSKDSYVFMEGGNLGYYDLDNGGVYINRKILNIGKDIYIICDEFYSSGSHKYNQYFHLNNLGEIELRDKNNFRYSSPNNVVDFSFISKGINEEIINSKFSKHYNLYENNKCIKTESFFDKFGSIFTVISVNKSDSIKDISIEKLPVKSNFKNIIFEDSMIEGIKITKGNEKYVVVVAHSEYASPTDSFNCDGCTGFGQVVVFNLSKGEKEIGTVMSY